MLKDNQKFEFVQKDVSLHDQKFETKRIGYFKDAMSRFKKNKGSVVSFVIIAILVLFSIIVPMVSRYEVDDIDLNYANTLPKLFENANGFWDGTKKKTTNEKTYDKYYYMGAVTELIDTEETKDLKGNINVNYTYRIDTYELGYVYLDLNTEKFNQVWEYNESVKGTDAQVLFPLVDQEWYKSDASIPSSKYSALGVLYASANYYYKVDKDLYTVKDASDNIVTCYVTDEPNSTAYVDSAGLVYAKQTGSTFRVRVHYTEYYKCMHDGQAAKFVFGTDNMGRDIFVRLATGGRVSLLLGFVVSTVNLLIGIIYGSIEGYFGGTVDLIMERICEILSEVPTIVVVTLMNLYFGEKFSVIVALFLAYILTGWIGTAGRTRMQMYRYKGQEYVLAARTLGANDFRIITRHVFPNAVGPIITGAVLMIPGVIFSESMLSYLNIINLSSMGLTSIGTMLDLASGYYTYFPHELLFPALFISLLMICFNIFGNGLRDAFNPSLRGVEE